MFNLQIHAQEDNWRLFNLLKILILPNIKHPYSKEIIIMSILYLQHKVTWKL